MGADISGTKSTRAREYGIANLHASILQIHEAYD
jgi:hypothetical protein